MTLTDLRSFARKPFAGSSADKLAEALSDETTVIVGGDGGGVVSATAVGWRARALTRRAWAP